MSRPNSTKEKFKVAIATLEAEIKTIRQAKGGLPKRVNISGLEDDNSFRKIDYERKNLFDFVTSSVWNARKQMLDLFYAITNCHGWVKSSKTEVIVRLEPIQQPNHRVAPGTTLSQINLP